MNKLLTNAIITSRSVDMKLALSIATRVDVASVNDKDRGFHLQVNPARIRSHGAAFHAQVLWLTALALVLLPAPCAFGTSVAVERTNDMLVVSADSAVTYNFRVRSICKIQRTDDVFVVMAGRVDSKEWGWNAYDIAANAIRRGGTLKHVADNFQIEMIKLLEQHPFHLNRDGSLPKKWSNLIQAGLGKMENGIATYAERDLTVGDDHRVNHESVDIPSDNSPYNNNGIIYVGILGAHQFADALRANTKVQDASVVGLVSGSRALVQAEIDASKDGSVGAPIATAILDEKGFRFFDSPTCTESLRIQPPQ